MAVLRTGKSPRSAGRRHGAGADGARPASARPAQGAARTVASRHQQTWESRFQKGMGGHVAHRSEGTGWEILSYLLAGLTAYGGIGWLIGHFTHIQLFFPIGMLVGIAISLGWVVYRYGRQ
jgi:ATP synthase protein I